MDDDLNLVYRVLASERDVYAELVRMHQRTVLATIVMRGVRGDEVEELALEAFVVYRRLDHFDQMKTTSSPILAFVAPCPRCPLPGSFRRNVGSSRSIDGRGPFAGQRLAIIRSRA